MDYLTTNKRQSQRKYPTKILLQEAVCVYGGAWVGVCVGRHVFPSEPAVPGSVGFPSIKDSGHWGFFKEEHRGVR